MDIILFSTSYLPGYGGVIYYTHHFFNSLKKQHSKVELIAPQNPNNDPNILLSNIKHDRKFNSGDNFFLTRKINTIAHIVQLRREAKKDIIDYAIKNKHLIVTSCYDFKTLIFLEECRKKKINYSVVFHGLDMIRQTDWNNNIWNKIFLRIIEGSSYLIFNSEASRKLYYERINIAKKSIIVYPGLDTKSIHESLSNINQDNLNFINNYKDDILVFSIGNLVKRKGFDIAVKAMKTVFEKFPDKKIKYLIAGDGENRENLQKLIKKENLQEKVHLIGRVSDHFKFNLLKESKVFVMPSYTLDGKDIEGFGIVYLEAAYTNNYVIGSNSGGVPEAVPPPPQGSLINIKDEESYKELAKELFLKLKLVINGEQPVVDEKWIEQYEWETIAKQFIDFLSKVMAQDASLK